MTDRRIKPAATDPPARPVAAPPLGDELERERLEPGLNTAGTGDVGAAPGKREDHDNSNT